MNDIWFYLKIVIVMLSFFSSINYSDLNNKEELIEPSFSELDSSFVLVEKNVVDKSIVSYLYKDDDNNYMDKIYDYYSKEELEIERLIKEDKQEEYNNKIEELLYLKYPKFIANALLEDKVKESYILRDNELVIYYNDYQIKPEVNEILYLKVNYNEIKDYLEFTVLLDSDYENESGYNYTNAKKAVAFTFDDSPNIYKTSKILSALKDNHFHATFFVVGNKVVNNKDLLISIKNLGNEIGSHSYNHSNMGKINDEEFIIDYKKMSSLYKSIFNEELKLTRPPYGIIKNRQLNLVNTAYIMWSLDTNDWRYRNSNYLVNYVMNNIKDGDIVLFHDSYSSTVKAIEELLPLLYSRGYQVMSVSELFNLKGLDIKNNKIYYNGH